MIRAVIVDDEPLARRRVRAFLRLEPDIEIVAECRNGEEAVRAIHEMRPQLVFLDVQMPGMDGFGVLEPLPRELMPLIVFVTAHDQYAVQAFERRALDYLLKPFSRERFHDAVSRVRERLRSATDPGLRERVLQLLQEVGGAPKTDTGRWMAIKAGGRVVVLDTAKIEWFESEGDYVRVHAGREVYLTRQTLNRIEMELGAGRFARVHRSAIVNMDFVKELHPLPGGDQALILRDGTQLTLSRGYRERVERLLRPR